MGVTIALFCLEKRPLWTNCLDCPNDDEDAFIILCVFDLDSLDIHPFRTLYQFHYHSKLSVCSQHMVLLPCTSNNVLFWYLHYFDVATCTNFMLFTLCILKIGSHIEGRYEMPDEYWKTISEQGFIFYFYHYVIEI